MERQPATHEVFEFERADDAWRNIDDVVMGGRSSSWMEVDRGKARFRGRLSLENNGGFASVRSDLLTESLAGAEGLALRLRGDGRTYQLRLRTDGAFDGPSYQMEIEPPKGVWTVLEIPFAAFRPTLRGRELTGVPPVASAEIRTIGILIADKQEGAFELEVDWIRAF